MTVNYKEGHIDSCVIIAEADGSKDRYFVAPEDADQSIRLIKNALRIIGKENPKVYISGFTLVTKNTNLSQEDIVNKILLSAEIVKPDENGIIEFQK